MAQISLRKQMKQNMSRSVASNAKDSLHSLESKNYNFFESFNVLEQRS